MVPMVWCCALSAVDKCSCIFTLQQLDMSPCVFAPRNTDSGNTIRIQLWQSVCWYHWECVWTCWGHVPTSWYVLPGQVAADIIMFYLASYRPSICSLLSRLLKWVSYWGRLNYNTMMYVWLPLHRAFECVAPYEEYIWLGYSSRDMWAFNLFAVPYREVPTLSLCTECVSCILQYSLHMNRYFGVCFGLTNAWVWLSSNATVHTKVQILVERIVGE